MLWQEYTAPDGRKYYYNTQTQETTWDKPKALEGTQSLYLFIPAFEVVATITFSVYQDIGFTFQDYWHFSQ